MKIAMTLLVALMLPATLWATTCTTDQDCAAGEYCVMTPCAMPDCNPDGGDCPEPQPCESVGECMSDGDHGGSFYGDECATDADCPMDFVCEGIAMPCATWACECDGGCACPPCPDGEECPPCECGDPEPCECPDPEPCEGGEVLSVCVFHLVECDTDADCGEGYECLAQEVCSGGGSVGCACPDYACACETCPEGQECPPCECEEPPPCECDDEPVDYEESCQTVGAFCAPKEIPCTADSDCPTDWECATLDVYGGVSCGCTAPACIRPEDMCPEGGADCLADAQEAYEMCLAYEPDCDCPEPEPVEAQQICLPGGWDDLIASGGPAWAEDVAGGSENAPQAAGLGDFIEEARDTAAAAPGTDGDGKAATGNAQTGGDGACTMGAPASGLAMALLLGLAGLALTLRRRVRVTTR